MGMLDEYGEPFHITRTMIKGLKGGTKEDMLGAMATVIFYTPLLLPFDPILTVALGIKKLGGWKPKTERLT